MDSIVVCAVFRDAAPFILEWIAFHRLIGVDRFVLYDLGSTDGTGSLIARSRFDRQVAMIDWSRNADHSAAHVDFVANHADPFDWAAIIDTTDFIHPLQADTLRALLPRYDGFSGVVLRRLLFAPAPQPLRPGALVTSSCTRRAPDDSARNVAALTLLRVKDIKGVHESPLTFALAGEACDGRGERLTEAALPPDADASAGLVINRYRHVPEPGPTVPDTRISRFVPRFRAMLHDVSMVTAPRPQPRPAAAPPPEPLPDPLESLLLGIGVVTFNRSAILADTLDRVERHTRHPRTIIAVADDGSTDGTLDMLRQRQILTVTGRNMSIAWNKNRALFLLGELLRCDVVILLEDDAYPERDHWEREWMRAAIAWGHANVAGTIQQKSCSSGSGTVDDPLLSPHLTAQCAVFSREALLFGGYFDTRFRGYGHEHVEHTLRLRRMGYGGEDPPRPDHPGMVFRMLWGGIGYHTVPSAIAGKDEQAERNRVLAQSMFTDFSYRAPFQNEEEARQMRDEMRRAFPRSVL